MKKKITFIVSLCAVVCMTVLFACAATVYKVTFDANGGVFGEEISLSVDVESGKTVTAPETAPTRSQYNFIKWYTDAACTTEFSFDTAISANITLYAGWSKIEASEVGYSVTSPTKLTYTVGETIDLTGLTVKRNMSDGTSVDVTDFTTNAPTAAFTAEQIGEFKLQVSVSGTVVKEFSITVVAAPDTQVTLTSIAVKTNPEKIKYKAGETFSSSGMVITATYSDDTERDITSGFTVSATSPFTKEQAGTVAVTVTFDGKETSLNVTVIKLKSLTIANDVSKKNYVLNEAFVATGLSLTATYSDNSTVATLTSGYTTNAPSTFTTPGTKTITITYTEAGESVSATTTVDVANIAPESISATIASGSVNKKYKSGETFDRSTLTVIATMTDGTTKTLNSIDYSLDIENDILTSTAANMETKTITVSYGGKTDTVSVFVIAPKSLAANMADAKTTYMVGETFNPEGIVLTVTYNDNQTVAEITVSSSTEGLTFSPNTAFTEVSDNVTVTLNYQGVTTDVTVVVKTSYTVQFDVNKPDGASGDIAVPENQTVISAGKVTKPNDPTLSGYKFMGWTTNLETKTLWEFDVHTVSESFTLHAMWQKLASAGVYLVGDVTTDGFNVPTTEEFKGALDGDAYVWRNIEITNGDRFKIRNISGNDDNTGWYDCAQGNITILNNAYTFTMDGDGNLVMDGNPVTYNGNTTFDLRVKITGNTATIDVYPYTYFDVRNVNVSGTSTAPVEVSANGIYLVGNFTNWKTLDLYECSVITDEIFMVNNIELKPYDEYKFKMVEGDEVTWVGVNTTLGNELAGYSDFDTNDNVLTASTELESKNFHVSIDSDKLFSVYLMAEAEDIKGGLMPAVTGINEITLNAGTDGYAVVGMDINGLFTATLNYTDVGDAFSIASQNFIKASLPAASEPATVVKGSQTVNFVIPLNGGDLTASHTFVGYAMTKLEVTTRPSKTDYLIDEEFDTTGLVLTLTYEGVDAADGKTAVFSGDALATTEGLTFVPSLQTGLTVEDNKVTATVMRFGKSVSADIAITVVTRTLNAINVELNQSSSSVYKVGESFDKSTITVTASYSAGGDQVIHDVDYTVDTTNFTLEHVGTKTITVTYDGKTATIDVTVLKAETIVVTTNPDKMTYYSELDKFDPTGMEITVYYGEGTDNGVVVAYPNDSITVEYSESVIPTGTRAITVTYTNDNVCSSPLTVNLEITVNESFAVTYDANKPETEADVIGMPTNGRVGSGEKITKPNDPTLSGYKFMGWEVNGVEYSFETAVSADVTLKATWAKLAAAGFYLVGDPTAYGFGAPTEANAISAKHYVGSLHKVTDIAITDGQKFQVAYFNGTTFAWKTMAIGECKTFNGNYTFTKSGSDIVLNGTPTEYNNSTKFDIYCDLSADQNTFTLHIYPSGYRTLRVINSESSVLTPDTTDGTYLVGNFNDWGTYTEYKFVNNQLNNANLFDFDELKIVVISNGATTWFGTNAAHDIDTYGTYAVNDSASTSKNQIIRLPSDTNFYYAFVYADGNLTVLPQVLGVTAEANGTQVAGTVFSTDMVRNVQFTFSDSTYTTAEHLTNYTVSEGAIVEGNNEITVSAEFMGKAHTVVVAVTGVAATVEYVITFEDYIEGDNLTQTVTAAGLASAMWTDLSSLTRAGYTVQGIFAEEVGSMTTALDAPVNVNFNGGYAATVYLKWVQDAPTYAAEDNGKIIARAEVANLVSKCYDVTDKVIGTPTDIEFVLASADSFAEGTVYGVYTINAEGVANETVESATVAAGQTVLYFDRLTNSVRSDLDFSRLIYHGVTWDGVGYHRFTVGTPTETHFENTSDLIGVANGANFYMDFAEATTVYVKFTQSGTIFQITHDYNSNPITMELALGHSYTIDNVDWYSDDGGLGYNKQAKANFTMFVPAA